MKPNKDGWYSVRVNQMNGEEFSDACDWVGAAGVPGDDFIVANDSLDWETFLFKNKDIALMFKLRFGGI